MSWTQKAGSHCHCSDVYLPSQLLCWQWGCCLIVESSHCREKWGALTDINCTNTLTRVLNCVNRNRSNQKYEVSYRTAFLECCIYLLMCLREIIYMAYLFWVYSGRSSCSVGRKNWMTSVECDTAVSHCNRLEQYLSRFLRRDTDFAGPFNWNDVVVNWAANRNLN